MTTLTINEHCYLHAISWFTTITPKTQEDIMDLANNPVWFNSAEFFGTTANGIAANLFKKGLAGADDKSRIHTKETAIWLTKKGAKALISANAEFGPAVRRKSEAVAESKKGTRTAR